MSASYYQKDGKINYLVNGKIATGGAFKQQMNHIAAHPTSNFTIIKGNKRIVATKPELDRHLFKTKVKTFFKIK